MLRLHPVTLTASSPAYFRGFILVALREAAEGDRDEDYAGNFQVRHCRFTPDNVCGEREIIDVRVGDTRVLTERLLPSPTHQSVIILTSPPLMGSI